MSAYHSDKCTKEELETFRENATKWLKENFTAKLKTRFLTCYGGEVRIYDDYIEYTNTKSSFRRTEPDYRDGKIVGWIGTRGKHTTRVPQYVSICRDEFDKIKCIYAGEESEEKDFYEDYLFSKLKEYK